MSDWRVALPSYGRSESVGRRTLATMLDGGVAADRITVYAGDDATYRLPAGVTLRRVPAGLVNANNAITDDHDEGALVVRADDDMREVVRLSSDGKKLEHVADVAALFDEAFDALTHARLTLWGVGPVANAFFMRPTWDAGLWFCPGALFGVRNVRSIRSTLPVKNDYERTLQHFLHAGAVLRLRDHTFKVDPSRKAKGGLQTTPDERRLGEQRAAALLTWRYPGLVHPKKTRDGYAEIALRLPART